MNASLRLGCGTKWTGIQRLYLGQKRVSRTAETGAMTVKDEGWAGSGQHYKDNQLVPFLSLVLLKGGRCAN